MDRKKEQWTRERGKEGGEKEGGRDREERKGEEYPTKYKSIYKEDHW